MATYVFVVLFSVILGTLGTIRPCHAATLQTTRSFRVCGNSDPEIPRFSIPVCPSSHAYTRATVSVDIGGSGGSANISMVGTTTNRTRPGSESTICEGPFCVPVTNTRVQWTFLNARAQWSLNPLGYAIPFSYMVMNTTVPINGSRCFYDHVPDLFTSADPLCDFGPSPSGCTSDTDCTAYAITPAVDHTTFGSPQCPELCCYIGDPLNATDANSYQVAMTTPMCQLYQVVGPPMLNATINVHVRNAHYNRFMNITGGIDDRVYGFQNDLRGFMRLTAANPSTFNLPVNIAQGYFAVCDTPDLDVYGSSDSLSDPPTCATDIGSRWFYIPPAKTGVYGLGAHQYGESTFDVLQDMATLGCSNESIFDLVVPGMVPNTNPFDPTSDYENPSPCTILGMINDGDPRSVYWLPPGFGSSDWQIDGAIVSVDIDTVNKYIEDAFIVDIDIPTLIMPYDDPISPGYVDESLSRCYTTGVNVNDTSLIPGFLSPMICNPPVTGSQTAQDQTYTVTYQCDPAVMLARTSDTIVVKNNQCKSTLVDYNISTDDINHANKVCNIVLSPGLDDPYPVQCAFGTTIPTGNGSCSLFAFGCNFNGENGGAWYRCIPFWIILAVVLAAVGLIIWYAVKKSDEVKLKPIVHGELNNVNNGPLRTVQ